MALLRQCLLELRAAQARTQAGSLREPSRTLLHERPATKTGALAPAAQHSMGTGLLAARSISSISR